MKRVLGTALGALGGGLLGHSHLICTTGQCPLTGSWYGGALLGGLIGLLLADALGPRKQRR